jgi:hypothetical protein
VPFAMWLMALLVNSNTLDEMIVVWQNICIILISPNQNVSVTPQGQISSKLDIQVNNKSEKLCIEIFL